MNFAYFRSIGAILALTILGLVPGVAAETGTIAAGTVNVRGRAGFIGEVITKLNRGDKVTIIEDVKLTSPKANEPVNWLKIALPANTPVWLHSSFIDPATHTVNATRLKVRGGPGVNYSVLGYLDRGTPIKEIRRVDDWFEIEPPAGLSAYIAANLVTRESVPTPNETATDLADTTTSTTNAVPTEPATTTTTTGAEKAPGATETETVTEQPVVAGAKTQLPKGADIGEPAKETPPTTEPAPTTPAPVTENPITTPPPTSTTIVAEPAPAIATTPTEPERNLTPEERATQALEQRTRNSQHWDVPLEQDDPLLKNLPEHRREVVREGKIRRALSIQAPGDYILEHVETGLRLNYLYTTSTNIPLKDLLGVKVRIKGEEGIDPRWPGTPVLLIKSLEVLP